MTDCFLNNMFIILGPLKQSANLTVYIISFLSLLFTQCYVTLQKYQLAKQSNHLEDNANESVVKWSNVNAYIALLAFMFLALMLFFSPADEYFYLASNFLTCFVFFVIVPFNIILKNKNLKDFVYKQLIHKFDSILNLNTFFKNLFVRSRKSQIIPIEI